MTDTLERSEIYGDRLLAPSIQLVDALGSAHFVLNPNQMLMVGLENDCVSEYVQCLEKINEYKADICSLPINEQTIERIATDYMTMTIFLCNQEGLFEDTEPSKELMDMFVEEIKERICRFSGQNIADNSYEIEEGETASKLIIAVMEMGKTPFNDIMCLLSDTEAAKIHESRRATHHSAA